jgi:hypothetical protein
LYTARTAESRVHVAYVSKNASNRTHVFESTQQARLGWQLHDGRRFGRHETLDAFSGVRIHHQFVKQRYRTGAGVAKEGWTLQINGSAFAGTAHAPAPDAPARNISVIWCVANFQGNYQYQFKSNKAVY